MTGLLRCASVKRPLIQAGDLFTILPEVRVGIHLYRYLARKRTFVAGTVISQTRQKNVNFLFCLPSCWQLRFKACFPEKMRKKCPLFHMDFCYGVLVSERFFCQCRFQCGVFRVSSMKQETTGLNKAADEVLPI